RGLSWARRNILRWPFEGARWPRPASYGSCRRKGWRLTSLTPPLEERSRSTTLQTPEPGTEIAGVKRRPFEIHRMPDTGHNQEPAVRIVSWPARIRLSRYAEEPLRDDGLSPCESPATESVTG